MSSTSPAPACRRSRDALSLRLRCALGSGLPLLFPRLWFLLTKTFMSVDYSSFKTPRKILHQPRRAAGVAIHGLVSLIKFFPGTAILIQPELHQNYYLMLIANFTHSQRDAGSLIHILVSLKIFPGHCQTFWVWIQNPLPTLILPQVNFAGFAALLPTNQYCRSRSSGFPLSKTFMLADFSFLKTPGNNSNERLVNTWIREIELNRFFKPSGFSF